MTQHTTLPRGSRATSAAHVVASLPGAGDGRIVVTAHIDSRRGSPGALDNASGVATLLAVASLLASYDGTPTIEFVPFNGEDDYANPGELRWVAENQGRFSDIVLGSGSRAITPFSAYTTARRWQSLRPR